MKKRAFNVIVNGYEMGTYRAASEEEALDVYAQDAGYRSYEHLVDTVPGAEEDDIKTVRLTDAYKEHLGERTELQAAINYMNDKYRATGRPVYLRLKKRYKRRLIELNDYCRIANKLMRQ